MSNLAYDLSASRFEAEAPAPQVSSVPRIAIDAFCDSPEIAELIEAAGRDRRLARARVSVRRGGAAAAVAAYAQAVTPDLIVLESRAGDDELLAQLDSLAAVCVARTKVLVIGHSNDIVLYRALLERGISEYLLAPVDQLALIGTISDLYRGEGAKALGKVIAFVGAKGGAGSSTIAHNVAWSIGRRAGASVILADLDLPFGTAGLDFNLDGNTGMTEALQDVEGFDELKLERLLTRYDDHLGLLSAPAELAQAYDLDESSFDRIVEVAQASSPFVALDIPHLWTSWARKLLLGADEVVITAEPDLASFRNAKALVELVREARPNDLPPRLVLNRVGMAKRPEIKAEEFSDALKIEPVAAISFEAQLFGTAANNGQMIGESAPRSKPAAAFVDLAGLVTGSRLMNTRKKTRGGLARLLGM